APSTLDDVWNRHIADSLQLYQIQPDAGIWLDLGSGGGFPGMITAIRLIEKSAGWVHLVESNQKKAAFLRVALQEIGARGTVHCLRIEDARNLIPDPDFISARALTDMSGLLDYSWLWMQDRPHMRLYFHKGRDYQSEIDKASSLWDFDLVKHHSVTAPDSVILEVSRLRRLAV
ncbi:MAG: rRNA ((527)-N(7))-methyltransferase RsmG, partial [Pseudomonadota bacterium]